MIKENERTVDKREVKANMQKQNISLTHVENSVKLNKQAVPQCTAQDVMQYSNVVSVIETPTSQQEGLEGNGTSAPSIKTSAQTKKNSVKSLKKKAAQTQKKAAQTKKNSCSDTSNSRIGLTKTEFPGALVAFVDKAKLDEDLDDESEAQDKILSVVGIGRMKPRYKKKLAGNLKFLVSWKGWDQSHNCFHTYEEVKKFSDEDDIQLHGDVVFC